MCALTVKMELLMVAMCIFLVAPTSGSDFLYPEDSDTFIPGVRIMPVRNDPDTDRIYFPGTASSPNTPRPFVAPAPRPPPKNEIPDIPEDLHTLDLRTLSRLNNISNIADFASMFSLDLPEEDETVGNLTVATRFGGGDDDAELASMANCKPELRTVELDLPHDSHTTFFPTCIRIERCGGCCFGPLLTCRPTITKAVKIKVLKTTISSSPGTSRRRGGRRRRRENTASYHTLSVVKHTACDCGCKVQASDCNSTIHTYREGECKCVCKDRDEKAKCEQQNNTKYWSDETCSCYCRKPRSCGSGEFFSQISCQCEHLLGRSGISFDEGSA